MRNLGIDDINDKILEGQFADKNFSASILVRPLNANGSWGGFSSGLGGELLARSFSSGRFICDLLTTGHSYS